MNSSYALVPFLGILFLLSAQLRDMSSSNSPFGAVEVGADGATGGGVVGVRVGCEGADRDEGNGGRVTCTAA